MRTSLHYGLADHASTSRPCEAGLLPHRPTQLSRRISYGSKHSRPKDCCVQCASLSATKGDPGRSIAGKKEAHKIFDEAVITVRSGKGGKGEIAEKGEGKKVPNFKYRAGSSLPKQMWLAAAAPADGAYGASVVLVADPALDNLLHLHDQKTYPARNGAAANPELGSRGPRGRRPETPRTQPLRIGVPLGTVVKRKRGGALLGELTAPGQTLVVARGGCGGLGVVKPSQPQQARGKFVEQTVVAHGGRGGLGVVRPSQWQQARGKFVEQEDGVVEDTNWAADAEGAPGEEVALHLLMRVVADVGIVGLPNAGKSSLLAALTRASPEIAPYPFTTLMPNLGVLAASRQKTNPEESFTNTDFMLADPSGSSMGGGMSSASGPVLADLPGLIQGAHAGRGLGRMFLRHLRRTRGLMYVIDASAEDPAADYMIVRQELALYNPEYCARPHVVALNKMDLDDAADLQQEVANDILAAAKTMQRDWRDAAPPHPVLPEVLIPVSATEGTGIAELREALQTLLKWDI